MEGAEMELERRSMFLKSLIQKKKNNNNKLDIEKEEEEEEEDENKSKKYVIRVRGSDMGLPLQKRAFHCARHLLVSMSPNKLDTKLVALTLKKEFDSSYGPAWHCIVGTSFGSYVTHSVGGFLYFSIDKVYILLFKTAVEPLH